MLEEQGWISASPYLPNTIQLPCQVSVLVGIVLPLNMHKALEFVHGNGTQSLAIAAGRVLICGEGKDSGMPLHSL